MGVAEGTGLAVGVGVGVGGAAAACLAGAWLPQATIEINRAASSALRELIHSQNTDQDSGSTTSVMRQQYQAAIERQGR